MQRAPLLMNKICTNKTQLFIKFTKLLYKLCSSVKYTAIIQLLCLQGQDLYKSKQVRDKQIARILGKVCSKFPILAFLGPSIASLLTPSYMLHMKASASVALRFTPLCLASNRKYSANAGTNYRSCCLLENGRKASSSPI